MAIKIIMPEMGEGVIEGTVSRWLKQEGDEVDQYEPILEIETDKVTTETTAEEAGTLLKILVDEGETVEVGTVLAYIGEPDEKIPANGETKAASVPAPAAPARSQSQPAGDGQPQQRRPYTGRISPVVGRIAEEHSVDLSLVEGTGRDGRITKKDILAYIERRDGEPEPEPELEVEAVAAPALKPEPAPAGAPSPVLPEVTRAAEPAVPGEIIPLTGIRRVIADHMVRSKHTSPHVTTIFEFDFSVVAAHRAANKERFARDGANLTYTAYIVAATVAALKAHPIVNSSWIDDAIELKRDINIGIAAAIEDGLIVPVIKNADSLNLLGLARAINGLAERARNKQLKPADVQGGTFSITNHGTSGSLFATPIINQPQCGILGVGKIEKRVKVIDDAIAIRPLAYVGLTFDHRILDGATADAFMTTIKDHIENWR
jgi:2-oxoglutarate dehydrogenase E2 component (dihydrolipoamide succinyltransferase)